MSIENFLNAYPADITFPQEMAKRSEYGRVSPIRLMADRYITEGASGLRELHDPILATLLNEDDEALEELTYPFMLNSASIFLGNTTKAIEQIISENVFDQISFNAALDFSFTGTGFNPTKFENPKVESVSTNDVMRMIKIAKKDKTFAEFFGDGIYTLPRSLQTYLGKQQILKQINILLLPDYIARTKLLISNNGKKHIQSI